jgi:hypothetical protein
MIETMGKWITLAFIMGCATNAPAPDSAMEAQTLFAQSVYPILLNTCASSSGGCHSDAHGLILTTDEPAAYQSVVSYAGDFTVDSLLFTAHTDIALDADAMTSIEAWLAQERDARGL